MKVYIKDRIKLVLLILLPVLVVGYFVYPTIFKKGVVTGGIFSVKVIDENNKEALESCNVYPNSYPIAIKTKDGNKFYLKKSITLNDRYELTEKQFNKLQDGEIYWIEVKYIRNNNLKKGNVKKIYTYNPTTR